MFPAQARQGKFICIAPIKAILSVLHGGNAPAIPAIEMVLRKAERLICILGQYVNLLCEHVTLVHAASSFLTVWCCSCNCGRAATVNLTLNSFRPKNNTKNAL